MPFERASGVLAHPTSFPGPHGIGDLGDGAHQFIDWLSAAEQRYWQIMPLAPVGPGNSPYASVSAFAANPLLISLPRLVTQGLLEDPDLHDLPEFSTHVVDYERAASFKGAKLRRAFDRFRSGAATHLRPHLATFLGEESSWIHDFALFHGSQTSLQWRMVAGVGCRHCVSARGCDRALEIQAALRNGLSRVRPVHVQYAMGRTEAARK